MGAMMAKSIKEQYMDLRAELDLNQQEYKAKQDKLLEQLEKLQDDCPHDNTNFNTHFNDSYTRCSDCAKIMMNKEVVNNANS